MILEYSELLGLGLLEPEDFKRFKLTQSGAARQPTIAGVTFIDDDHALIDAAQVPTLPSAPQTEDWRAGYRVMIHYAVTKGWLNAGAVRAHVERTAGNHSRKS